MRDGFSLLDQAMAFGGKTIRHQDLEALLGAVPQELVRAMIEAGSSKRVRRALQVIAGLLDQGHDVRAYCAESCGVCAEHVGCGGGAVGT